MKQERRTFTGTVIARSEGENMPKEIGGIAAVINSVTDLGYFEEVIERGAFDYALSKEYDIRCLFNHEAELILGRTLSGTCNVFVNGDGNLEYTWIPDYENPTHMSVVRSIMRGDITQSSFAFTIKEQKWSDSTKYGTMGKRTITVIEDLYDVSPIFLNDVKAVDVKVKLTCVLSRVDSYRNHEHNRILLILCSKVKQLFLEVTAYFLNLLVVRGNIHKCGSKQL